MLDRRIESVFGWPLHLSTSPNQRTLYNFPMQGGGAEMLRLAAVAAVRGRHRADHARARRHPARGDRPREDRARQRDHARRRPRRLRRLRDRRRCRPDARRRRPLPRQAARGEGDVGDDHGHAGGDRRPAEEGDGMTRTVYAHGRLDRGRDPRHRPANQKAAAPGGDVRQGAAAVGGEGLDRHELKEGDGLRLFALLRMAEEERHVRLAQWRPRGIRRQPKDQIPRLTAAGGCGVNRHRAQTAADTDHYLDMVMPAALSACKSVPVWAMLCASLGHVLCQFGPYGVSLFSSFSSSLP